MIIISWDIGIKHLAYSIITYNDSNNIKINDFNMINIDNKLCFCNNITTHFMIIKHNLYNKNIPICNDKYYLCSYHYNIFLNNNIFYIMCYLFSNKIFNFSIFTLYKKCDFCDNLTSFYNINDSHFICIKHLKKYFTFKNFNNKYDSIYSKKKIIHILSNNPCFFNVNVVLIENQPALKNPIMKSLCNTIHDFYLIKKIHNIFLLAPNKKINTKLSEFCNIYIPNSNKNKYTLFKQYSINIISHLLKLKNNDIFLKFNQFKKKDDICDTLLLLFYFLDNNYSINFNNLSLHF